MNAQICQFMHIYAYYIFSKALNMFKKIKSKWELKKTPSKQVSVG